MGLTAFAGLDWTWKVAASAVLVSGAIEAYALADRSRGEPRNLDMRRYVIGEIFDGHAVEQRFFVKANGLSSVTIYPRPASPAPTGRVFLELRDITDDADRGVLKKRESIPLPSLARMQSFTMRFLPQESLYRQYALQVNVAGSSDGQGIGLLATRGGSFRSIHYHTPTLWTNGNRQFGNLVFQTTVDTATSNFGSIASQLARGGIPAPRLVLLFVLIGKYLALFVIIRAFAHSSSGATLGAQAPPSLPA